MVEAFRLTNRSTQSQMNYHPRTSHAGNKAMIRIVLEEFLVGCVIAIGLSGLLYLIIAALARGYI
jgi:hypothetical protein